MAISGYLSEFSLPELFQLLEQGNKTGRLSIQERSACPTYKGKIFRIWFQQGSIIAAADRADGLGLTSLMQQRGWINAQVISRIAEICAFDKPTGLCLKEQGLLEAEQLKILFSQQVLQQVCKLFELQDGQFQFDVKATLPYGEMTGLTALPKEVTLASLRVLKDWTTLLDKLPDATSGLINVVVGKPKLRLNQLEWQVWEFANGLVPIHDIAQQLNLPIEKIQQVAFRLMVVSLAEEVPLVTEKPLQQPVSITEQSDFGISTWNNKPKPNVADVPISQSFLKNLVGFLKSKT